MRVIIDSSALIAMLSETDADHGRAVAVREALSAEDQSLLPYEVLAETLNVLGRKLDRGSANVAARVLLRMHEDGEIRLVDPSPGVIKRATELQPTATGGPSFVDCLVMAYADQYDTPYIFGFDATFRKNGYSLPGERRSSSSI
jgi:predicted nucleic acid-binding protein